MDSIDREALYAAENHRLTAWPSRGDGAWREYDLLIAMPYEDEHREPLVIGTLTYDARDANPRGLDSRMEHHKPGRWTLKLHATATGGPGIVTDEHAHAFDAAGEVRNDLYRITYAHRVYDHPDEDEPDHQTLTVKAHGGDRVANLNAIADAIQGATDQHRLNGYAEQLRIIAAELHKGRNLDTTA